MSISNPPTGPSVGPITGHATGPVTDHLMRRTGRALGVVAGLLMAGFVSVSAEPFAVVFGRASGRSVID